MKSSSRWAAVKCSRCENNKPEGLLSLSSSSTPFRESRVRVFHPLTSEKEREKSILPSWPRSRWGSLNFCRGGGGGGLRALWPLTRSVPSLLSRAFIAACRFCNTEIHVQPFTIDFKIINFYFSHICFVHYYLLIF